MGAGAGIDHRHVQGIVSTLQDDLSTKLDDVGELRFLDYSTLYRFLHPRPVSRLDPRHHRLLDAVWSVQEENQVENQGMWGTVQSIDEASSANYSLV